MLWELRRVGARAPIAKACKLAPHRHEVTRGVSLGLPNVCLQGTQSATKLEFWPYRDCKRNEPFPSQGKERPAL